MRILFNSFLCYSIMEHRSNDLHYEHMIPCQVTSDLNKEKTIAFLLKELDILRASNKKVQYRKSGNCTVLLAVDLLSLPCRPS